MSKRARNHSLPFVVRPLLGVSVFLFFGAACGSSADEPSSGAGAGEESQAGRAGRGNTSGNSGSSGRGGATSGGAGAGGDDLPGGGGGRQEGGVGAAAGANDGGARTTGGSAGEGEAENAGATSTPAGGAHGDAGAGGASGDAGGGPSPDAGAGGQSDGPPPLGVYDADDVYLWGTLDEGLCFRDAIAPVYFPNSAATGFSCSGGGATTRAILGSFIHPTKRRLMFILGRNNTSDLLFFVPDGDGTGDYPTLPHSNDEVVDDVCGVDDHGNEVAGGFVTPDTGEVVYACADLGCVANYCRYFHESGLEYIVPADHVLVTLGYAGSALLATGDHLVLRNPDGQLFPLEVETTKAVRAHPAGFWVAHASSTGTSPERLNVSFDGSVTSDGKYPEPPVSTEYGFPEDDGNFTLCRFDKRGAIFCFAQSSLDNMVDQILRAELGKARADVVYTEASAPRVRVHISYLVSGP